jgi:enoyl-CoA hydratase/carnithine racemase
MSDGRSVRLERAGGLAVVTIDNPPLNLFDARMGEELEALLDDLEADPPRAVLFRAEGRVVSGGVDVALFDAQPDVQHAIDLFNRLLSVTRRTEQLACPTVFAAHGLCLTWAFELALACDMILAGASASFGLVEKVVGLTPAMGGTQRLAERAGSGRAREFVMTGVPYPASKLESWNVVNRVLDDEDFDDQARAFASELADGPTLAHAATKRVIAAFREGGVRGADEQVAAIAGELFASRDLRGAVRSFLDDGPGKATFSGQ